MAGNLLWAHLLRKDATTTETPSQIPPIAPQDKTGTSMRMLIHDTQANLEKFSTRLDGLFQRVDDCRTQIVNANKLLDVERDKVLAEMLEIAGRYQVEMKAHVGTPAQASALELVRVAQVSTETSVQALEKRIDALQALLQTHVHAMQSIQDQQNTILGAVMPLVPIVHGVPTQVDRIEGALSDTVASAVMTMTSHIENLRSALVAELAHDHGRAGSSTRVGSSSKSLIGSRRRRSNAPVLSAQETDVLVSSPLDSRSHGGPHANLKRARVEGENAQLPRKLSRLTLPPENSGDPPLVVQTPRTPRRPLADLLLPPGTNTPRTAHHGNSTTRGYMHPLSAAGGPLTIPRTTLQLQVPAITGQASHTPVVSSASDQDALSKAIKLEEVQPRLTGVFSIHSSPLSSLPSSAPHAICHGLNETTRPTTQHDLRDDAPLEVVQVASDPVSNVDVSPPKSMSLRDRRAQMSRIGRTETRRFIPLVPWSDEED